MITTRYSKKLLTRLYLLLFLGIALMVTRTAVYAEQPIQNECFTKKRKKNTKPPQSKIETGCQTSVDITINNRNMRRLLEDLDEQLFNALHNYLQGDGRSFLTHTDKSELDRLQQKFDDLVQHMQQLREEIIAVTSLVKQYA